VTTSIQTEPAVEPVTFADMQAQSHIDDDVEQSLVEEYITAARKYCEVFTRRAFITQTIDLSLQRFPTVIECPAPPLQSVTSITYIDGDGASQTLAASVYQVDIANEPGRIKLAFNQSWPTIRASDWNPVVVRYVAGYGAAATAVPAGIKHAIKLLAANWFENREPLVTGTIVQTIPMTIESLLWQHRIEVIG